MSLTDREQQIYQRLLDDPLLSQQALAAELGIARASIAAHITNLTQKGYIQGRGYLLNDIRPQVVVIGGANIDLIGFPEGKLIWQDSNPGRLRSALGGVGRNIADNLARLGLQTTLLSAVGDDARGQQLIDGSERAGIDMQRVKVVPDAETATYLSVMDETGDLAVALADMAVVAHISPAYCQAHLALIRRADRVVIDTNLSADTLAYLLNNAGAASYYVDAVSATKAKKLKPHLDQIDTLKVNRLEAEVLSGVTVTDDTQAQRAIDKLLAAGVRQVCLSLGSDGILLATTDTQRHHQAQPADVRNTTGAGDSLMAGLIYASLQAYNIAQTAAMAATAAGITVEAEDTIHPAMTASWLEQRCRDHNPDLFASTPLPKT